MACALRVSRPLRRGPAGSLRSLLVLAFVFPWSGHAEGPPELDPGPPPDSDHLLPDWGGTRSHLSNQGVEFGVSYTGEVLGNVSGGIEQGAIYEGLLKVQVDLDTGKLHLWPSGTFHGSMLYTRTGTA